MGKLLWRIKVWIYNRFFIPDMLEYDIETSDDYENLYYDILTGEYYSV